MATSEWMKIRIQDLYEIAAKLARMLQRGVPISEAVPAVLRGCRHITDREMGSVIRAARRFAVDGKPL